MLQQRLIRSGLERGGMGEDGRGGWGIFLGSLNHTVRQIVRSATYQSEDLCQCKTGARCSPCSHCKSITLAVDCVETKNLLTHALCRPVSPAFVRNVAYSPSIKDSWGHRLYRPHEAPHPLLFFDGVNIYVVNNRMIRLIRKGDPEGPHCLFDFQVILHSHGDCHTFN